MSAWFDDITPVTRDNLPRANLSPKICPREEANPLPDIRLPFTYFCGFTDACEGSESNEFVIRRESRLFSLVGFTDAGSSLVHGPLGASTEIDRASERKKKREEERRGERVWKPRGPSLADRWKIHKLFQEKRRKSISNYSFLWRVAAGHARQGVRLMATRAHRSTSSASLLLLLLLHLLLRLFLHPPPLSLSPDSSVSFDAANAVFSARFFFFMTYIHPPYTQTHILYHRLYLSSLASGWRIPVTRKISIILETFSVTTRWETRESFLLFRMQR